MKKHLIIICGIYYPKPSPTGLCAERFSELLSDKYDIEIISLSDNGRNETVTQDNGIIVHTLSGKRSSLEKKAHGVLKKAVRAVGGVQIKTSILGNLGWYKSYVLKKLVDIDKKNKIDVVFSICSPMAAHCAAYEFKRLRPEARWCAYTVDPYSSSTRIRPLFCSLELLERFESKILHKTDALLLSEEVFNNRKELYKGHQNCHSLPYMLPNVSFDDDSKKAYFSEEGIHCVYAGRLYPDLREPDNMLKTFSLLEDKNIKLHLFSVGCDEKVRAYAEKNTNIILHDRVSHKEIVGIYSEADFLVNIGNNSREFFPSKTFEYIVSGKPILHFYGADQKDDILEKYPLVTQIDNNSECIDIQSVESFIKNNVGSRVDSEKIEKIFYKHTKDNIRSILFLATEVR